MCGSAQQQQQQQSLYPNAQCSHQCQGFHATPANTPTSWGGNSSSTKHPNDSSPPPTPSFPPYDVGTLHFVACGRPWLLHWRGESERERDRERERERERERSWSHFWGKFLVRYGNTQKHLSHMIWYTIHMVQMIRTGKIVGHICETNSWADVGVHKYTCYI